jgi:hypothetical protein
MAMWLLEVSVHLHLGRANEYDEHLADREKFLKEKFLAVRTGRVT